MGLKEKFETRKSIESLPNLASNKLELIKSIKDSCVKINTSLTRFLDKHFKLSPQLPTFETVSKWMNLAEKPLETPMLTYIGAPVLVEVAEPTDANISELREKYFKALETLYAETRPKEYEPKLYII